MAFLQYPLALIVTLGILVTIHEFGHFIVARWSGVRVLRFSVGFGRPIWSRTDKHGTEFALAVIPLGGYVRMLDERELAPGETLPAGSVAHNQLTPLWKMAIAFGGPLANFLLAIFVYWCLFVAGTTSVAPLINTPQEESPAALAGIRAGTEIVAVDGVPTQTWQQITEVLANRLGETGHVELRTSPPSSTAESTYRLPIRDWQVGEDQPDLLGSLGINPDHPAIMGVILPDSAAQRAGLAANDWVQAVNGEPIQTWLEWVEVIQQAPGTALEVELLRAEQPLTLTVVPDEVPPVTAGEPATGYLGVSMSLREVRYGPAEALLQSLEETQDKTLLTLSLLKKMIFGQVSLKNLSGPITIAEVAGDSARMGLAYFLGVLALLSISLGVLNLLPIPILDGGHILYALAELASGRPVPERVQIVGLQVGVFLVGGLMILALFNDFSRLMQ